MASYKCELTEKALGKLEDKEHERVSDYHFTGDIEANNEDEAGKMACQEIKITYQLNSFKSGERFVLKPELDWFTCELVE